MTRIRNIKKRMALTTPPDEAFYQVLVTGSIDMVKIFFEDGRKYERQDDYNYVAEKCQVGWNHKEIIYV
ncbi:MAG: hypothetical protein COT17_07290 [Elusimicrobia bacterium CG08_land_8_20_14_0_20_51_18]|nr:MAG: hypothetical protein COT17_07290 [Elusimicrobia bacterium CG08_land_8_20_14_0_20_51_18]